MECWNGIGRRVCVNTIAAAAADVVCDHKTAAVQNLFARARWHLAKSVYWRFSEAISNVERTETVNTGVQRG